VTLVVAGEVTGLNESAVLGFFPTIGPCWVTGALMKSGCCPELFPVTIGYPFIVGTLQEPDVAAGGVVIGVVEATLALELGSFRGIFSPMIT